MKKVFILMAIFAGLFAFVYFYEIQGEKQRQEAKEKADRAIKLERDNISEIEIVRKDGETILLKKAGDTWSVHKPIETPADANAVDSLLGAIAGARVERKLEEGAKNAAQYGLSDPRVRLNLTADKEKACVLLGADDYTGNQVYLQVEGSADVYLTSDTLFTSADKELKDWRSRKVLGFDRAQVQNVEINRPGEVVRLKREGEKWRLESPVQEQADESTVSSLLSTLEFAEAQRFVAEQPQDLKGYGLDSPAVFVRLREQGKDSWKTLQLGRKEEDLYLARDTDRTPVFAVKAEVYEKLTQKVWEFRDKSVVDVDQDEVSEISFRSADTEIILKHQDDGKWTVQKPESVKGKEALTYKFWYPLTDIKYQSFKEGQTQGGSGKPEIEVTVTLKDGKRRSYEFFSSGTECLARKVDSNRTGTITKESFEALRLKPEDLV